MKVIVGISGGVDSSVSALCLTQQGYEVEALFMKNWHEDTESGECSWEADVEDALQVCDTLNIPLNTVDLSADYWDSVFSTILEDFKKGLTPNPDILCNQEIKFKAFHDHALTLGADLIATGHYARIDGDSKCNRLLKGVDVNKDQSYFLCRLNQEQLSRSLFPIGEMNKDDVRNIARDLNFKTHDKKDSTGICFIGERPFKEFLGQFIPVNKGPIMTADGLLLGEHDGVYFYTIGQRQGLGIGGIRGNSGEPWYVIDKDKGENILFVAQGENNELLYSSGVNSVNLHWIGHAPADYPYHCHAKTRYRQADQACIIEYFDGNTARIVFKVPQRAVTPGQYIVFYDDEICLGGGVIASSFR